MALKVALQMDPIGSVNINGDSTYRIGLEAQARGRVGKRCLTVWLGQRTMAATVWMMILLSSRGGKG